MEAASVATVVSTLASTFFSYDNILNQKKAAKAERKAANRQAELNRQQIQATLAEQQRKNRNLLAQQQSAYKAKLGASGLSQTSGSGQVVLNNMQTEHDMEDKYLQSQANISLEALRNSIERANTENLLRLRTLNNSLGSNLSKDLNTLVSSATSRSVIK